MTDELILSLLTSLIGFGWFCTGCLQEPDPVRELAHGECSISPLCATVHAEGSEGFHVQLCCGVAELLQALSASSLLAVLWEAVQRELVVLQA